MTNTDAAPPISDKQKLAVLQQALDHIQRNQVGAAEALLSQILAFSGEEPDALQLMGVIRRMQGADEDAENFYRRSLAAKPAQPQVHHNLGNLLKASGRLDDAIASQREAIRLKRDYLEAHLNLGLGLFAKGDHAQAEKSFRDALRIQPNYTFAQQSLGALFNEMGRPKDAELILRRALVAGALDTRQIAALEHNLGVSMLMQERAAEALALFDAAQSKVPNLLGADYNRGNALQQLGQLEAAVAAYRRAIHSAPLNMLAHRDLNHLLYRLKEDDQFLRSYDEAMTVMPEIGDLPLAKATFLFQKEDYEAARENFARAAELMTHDVMPRDGLGLTLARMGDFDAAIRAHEDAIKLEPENAHAWRNFSETLLRAGDARKAMKAAESALAVDPDDQGALAMLGTATRLLDDGSGGALNDYENLVQTFDIEPPEGYKDIETFNRDLNEYLDRLHLDKREVLMQTLRGGTQTFGDIFNRGHDLVERLRMRIDQAVNTYIAGMKDDADHPLFRRRRRSFAYSGSWSARLHDCGFHTNHFHTKGWISSAYYVAVPDAAEDVGAKQGWLKFGEPAFDAGLKDPVRRIVQPRVGKLVLFPSYAWHGTNPFHSQQSRTSIAFDVVPR